MFYRHKTRGIFVEFTYNVLHLVISFRHWICALATFWQNYYGIIVNLTYEPVTLGTVDRFFIIDIHDYTIASDTIKGGRYFAPNANDVNTNKLLQTINLIR